MSQRTILVWFRNDLRIRDNEILLEAVKKGDRVVPVYCFDPRSFSVSSYGTLKTGVFRAEFLIESVSDLKNSLQQLGGDLMVLRGKPEELLPIISQKYSVNEVYHHREVAPEETEISALVEGALWKQQINLKHFIGHTLYHKEDLPFPIKDIPDVFATFRKKVERESEVRACFDTPDKIILPENFESDTIPNLKDLGLEEPYPDEGYSPVFLGGETEGLKRMNEYFWEKGQLNHYKASPNSLISSAYSSRLSPWLSLGCLSTREVYWEIKKYEKKYSPTNSTHKLTLEFLWRDYFRFMFKKYGNKFLQEALSEEGFVKLSQKENSLFEKWKSAQTGIPFIDAGMRQLNLTGFLSNKVRQSIASFFVHDLKLNWKLGAAYFEEKLIDYSPASNWGNWAFAVGLINNPKEKRRFDVLKHAFELDPKGEYVRKWLPELASIPGAQVHQPWLISPGSPTVSLTAERNYARPVIELTSV